MLSLLEMWGDGAGTQSTVQVACQPQFEALPPGNREFVTARRQAAPIPVTSARRQVTILVTSDRSRHPSVHRLAEVSPGRPARISRATIDVGCVLLATGVHTMRTNVVIDDKLMQDTLRATGLKTKREAVELGLRTLVRLGKQTEIRRLRGKLAWEGDLEAMRTDK